VQTFQTSKTMYSVQTRIKNRTWAAKEMTDIVNPGKKNMTKKTRNPSNDEEKDTYSIIRLLSSITTNFYCQEQETVRNV
jgi:hypothetical protein